jgi:3-oxoacyl-[acyl-carrier protein] reductase
MKLLEGKIALVTGGTSGIGYGIAGKFLEQGCHVVLFAQNPEKGEKAVAEAKSLFPESSLSFVSVDVSQTSVVEEKIKEILREQGKIDILVNNAGITRDGLLMKMSEEDWDNVLDINVKSCFNTCRAVARAMLKARSGKIINISSVVGLVGNPGQVNYAASKGAMIAMTKAMALEFASRNIQVNCIAPGFIETQMTDLLTQEQKGSILARIPLGRMGKTEEVADAALFLASSLSSYITGQVLTVDGGMVM